MPRPKRVHLNGALYYVTSRSLEGMSLFKDHEDYRAYLEFLKTYQAEFGFRLFAYSLLPNEVHLCLELTTDTTLSTIMHGVTSRYTKYYNKRYAHTGHLFGGRFKDVLMEKTPSLLRAVTHLHLLPVRLGMTSDPAQYAWTSYGSYVAPERESTGPHLGREVAEVLQALSRDGFGQTYARYALAVPAREWDEFAASLNQRVIGSDAFVSLVSRQRAADPSRPAPQPQPQPSPMRRRRMPSFALAGSVAAALVVVGVALTTQDLDALKEQISALARPANLHVKLASLNRQGAQRHVSLNGTAWQLEVSPLAESGEAAVHTDHLRFEQNMVLSSRLSQRGVMPSAYVMHLRGNGRSVWEATQTSPAGDVIRWRGELTGDTMQGVMTHRALGQEAKSYRFVATALARADGETQTRSEI